MNKVIGWIALIAGLYEVLAILVDSVPGVLVEGVWGWVIGVVLVVVGAYLLLKK